MDHIIEIQKNPEEIVIWREGFPEGFPEPAIYTVLDIQLGANQ